MNKTFIFVTGFMLILSPLVKAETMLTDTIEKPHTTTVYSEPEICLDTEISKVCKFFKNIYVSSFEHDYIRFLSESMDYSGDLDDTAFERIRANQYVTASYDKSEKSNLLSVVISVRQEFKGKTLSFTNAHNLNLKTHRMVDFSELFEDSKLAATICANEIYMKYSNLGYNKIHIVRALYELNPINFIIKSDGLEFIFERELIAKTKEQSKVFIPLEKLKDAKPNEKIFSL